KVFDVAEPIAGVQTYDAVPSAAAGTVAIVAPVARSMNATVAFVRLPGVAGLSAASDTRVVNVTVPSARSFVDAGIVLVTSASSFHRERTAAARGDEVRVIGGGINRLRAGLELCRRRRGIDRFEQLTAPHRFVDAARE